MVWRQLFSEWSYNTNLCSTLIFRLDTWALYVMASNLLEPIYWGHHLIDCLPDLMGDNLAVLGTFTRGPPIWFIPWSYQDGSAVYSAGIYGKCLFGRFVKIFLIFRKWTIPSESTIKPTSNCFEWWCCHVIIPNNKISLCILPMAECSKEQGGGTPNIVIFWLFLDNLSIYEQTIDRALTIHREL